MAILALTVAYDGAGFAGSQTQRGARTVQGELEAALAGLMGEPERTVFAGRTDRGVHAAGQVVGCRDRRPDLPPEAVRAALNAHLADDLAVLRVVRMPDGFHARYDARWREYRYRIWSGVRQPLARGQVWQRSGGLDLRAMEAAARDVAGEHDFAALAGAGQGVPWSERKRRQRGTVRRVIVCAWREIAPWWGPADGRLIELRIAADGFLPHMVRNLAAALVEVGRGARPPDWVRELLAAKDRRAGAGTAPAHGLVLWRVGYDRDVPDEDE